MRYQHVVMTICMLLAATMSLCAAPRMTVKSVGFNGYYRQGTLVPVTVLLENDDASVKGELRLKLPDFNNQPGEQYRCPIVLPQNARQVRTLYIMPPMFYRSITVEFVPAQGATITASFDQCQELYPTDRLMVIIGGSGSALSYINGQSIANVPPLATPRSWDFVNYMQWREERARLRQLMRYAPIPSSGVRPPMPPPPGAIPGGPGVPPKMVPPSSPYAPTTPAGPSGTLRVISVDSALLPENAEAYGSVNILALMSDITERTLGNTTSAITSWVASGGHLLIAGGGVPARLQAPFFERLLPDSRPGSETLTDAEGHVAVSAPYAIGRVTYLHDDPEAVRYHAPTTPNEFYTKLAAKDDQECASSLTLFGAMSDAVMVQSIRPINMQQIFIFLMAYLVILVLVNFIILRKVDKRELTWVTTLGIILTFTLGAYGIGIFSKGRQLTINVMSVIDATSGQSSAIANTQMLIFSPAHRNYQINLGDTGLLAKETSGKESDEYNPYSGQRSLNTSRGLHYVVLGESLAIEKLNITMWGIKQFISAHNVDLGRGISSSLTSDASTNTATGTVANNTEFDLPLCTLYHDGTLISRFSLLRGETATIKPDVDHKLGTFQKDEQHMIESVGDISQSLMKESERLKTGFTLICFTDDRRAQAPVRVNNAKPTSAVTMLVVDL